MTFLRFTQDRGLIATLAVKQQHYDRTPRPLSDITIFCIRCHLTDTVNDSKSKIELYRFKRYGPKVVEDPVT